MVVINLSFYESIYFCFLILFFSCNDKFITTKSNGHNLAKKWSDINKHFLVLKTNKFDSRKFSLAILLTLGGPIL